MILGSYEPAIQNLIQAHSDCGALFFVLAHLARIAFLAISWRRSGVSFSSLALAPSWPKATAWGFFSFFCFAISLLRN